jgi:hypothetical protein
MSQFSSLKQGLRIQYSIGIEICRLKLRRFRGGIFFFASFSCASFLFLQKKLVLKYMNDSFFIILSNFVLLLLLLSLHILDSPHHSLTSSLSHYYPSFFIYFFVIDTSLPPSPLVIVSLVSIATLTKLSTPRSSPTHPSTILPSSSLSSDGLLLLPP